MKNYYNRYFLCLCVGCTYEVQIETQIKHWKMAKWREWEMPQKAENE